MLMTKKAIAHRSYLLPQFKSIHLTSSSFLNLAWTNLTFGIFQAERSSYLGATNRSYPVSTLKCQSMPQPFTVELGDLPSLICSLTSLNFCRLSRDVERLNPNRRTADPYQTQGNRGQQNSTAQYMCKGGWGGSVKTMSLSTSTTSEPLITRSNSLGLSRLCLCNPRKKREAVPS